MSTITWLHLSDLHFRADKLHAWDADIVLRELLKDLRTHLEEGLRPDLILVSGDIAFSGAPAEYDLARAFLDHLLEATALPRERLFLVPGNHDVDRKKIGFMAKTVAPSLDNRDAVNELLADPAARHAFFARFEGYAAFVGDYLPGHLPFDDDRYFYVRPLDLAGRRVAVLGLNSAWLAHGGEEDRHCLALGERQVRAALDAAANADLRIALLHHPPEWLADFDRQDCEALLAQDCDFLLHGHLHRTGLTFQQTPDDRTMVIAAGASYEKRTSDNNYNLVRLDTEAGQGTVTLRAWSDRRGGFWTKDVLTYKNVKDGQYTFSLALPATVPGKRKEPTQPPVLPAVDAARLEAAYLRKVQLACNALPLALIDPRAVERTRQRTMDLLAVYVDPDTETPLRLEEETLESKRVAVLDQLLELPAEEKRLLPEALRLAGKRRLLTALEAVARERQMVLLGDPGSGKSTFASFLALCLAGARLAGAGEPSGVPGEGWLVHLEPAWSHGPLLPLRITLRHFAASDGCDGTAAGLWDFIAAELATQGLADFTPHLRQRLLDGGVLVIGDGLDEVADPAEREATRDAMAGLASTYNHPANRYLVTCRGYAYQDLRWQLEQFQDHTLAAFRQDQIDAFVECWYQEVCRLGWRTEAEAQDLTRRLQAATRRPDLAPLARSPLQLTMMASIHFSWGRLPDDRVGLYQEMVRLLLVRWQEARLGQDAGVTQLLSAADLESALESVAFAAHRAQEGPEGTADIGEQDLRRVLKDYLEGSWDRAGELVTYIRERAGLLLEREPGIYTFPHRSYQEFLAGSHLAVQPDFPDLTACLIEENDTQWLEVVLWAVGVMARLKRMTHVAVDAAAALCPRPVPEGTVEDDEWRAAHLTGQALLEIGLKEVRARERHAQVLERVQDWLVALLERGALAPVARARAGRTLGSLGDPRFDPEAFWLPGRYHGQPEPLLGFLPVPAGGFQMGSDRYDREKPVHPVELGEYYVARYPVTVAQFRAFVQDSDFRPVSLRWLEAPDNHPLRRVSWHEARAYCAWLTTALRAWEHLPPALGARLRDQGWVVRLPTEAEWEKAARGTGGREYPWGDAFDVGKCNTSESGIWDTTAVGTFPGGASPCGALDMSGNLFEWCQSLYEEYPYRAGDGRENLEAGGARVLRGGAFHDLRNGARCAYRVADHPDSRWFYVGFRLVVSPALPSDS